MEGNGYLDRLAGIRDEGGIRISHLLSTLQHHNKDAIEWWKCLAENLKNMISERLWTTNTLAGEKLRHWIYSGMLTIVIVFESADEDREDFQRICERQWYEDIFEGKQDSERGW